MTEKIERYIKRTKRHLKKYPDSKDWFTESPDADKWTLKDLYWWLDWNVIPAASMCKSDGYDLRIQLEILLQEHYKEDQLSLIF